MLKASVAGFVLSSTQNKGFKRGFGVRQTPLLKLNVLIHMDVCGKGRSSILDGKECAKNDKYLKECWEKWFTGRKVCDEKQTSFSGEEKQTSFSGEEKSEICGVNNETFTMRNFLRACKIKTPPQCEECKLEARFLIAYVEEVNHGLSHIQFHRVCLEHLDPELGADHDRTYSYEVIDLQSELSLEPFTKDKIEQETREYYLHDLALRELKQFVELSIKEDKHLVNTEAREKILAECKVEFGAEWVEYHDVFKKLFCCCRNNSDYKSFIETQDTEAEMFSDSSCDIYRDFFSELLYKHEITSAEDVPKKLGEFAPCVKNIGIIFANSWFYLSGKFTNKV